MWERQVHVVSLLLVLCLTCCYGFPLSAIENATQACGNGMRASAPKLQGVINIVQSALNSESGGRARVVLEDCLELLKGAMGSLNEAKSKVQHFSERSLEDGDSDDIWTWTSTVLTGRSTCADELEALGATGLQGVLSNAKGLQKDLSNSLALYTNLRKKALNQSRIHQRKLGSEEPSFPYKLTEGLPAWMPSDRRRFLLQNVTANLVVSKDGKGNFTSVQAAINASSPGYVIYVKKGTYNETVEVPSSMANLTIIGDGINKTIISASNYYAQAGTTFRTATFGVKATGFIGRLLTIQNNAGPENHQAVALLVTSDKVAFYKCSMVAYQDTLYTYANRQFYRECQVTGTVDFIFGNSAVVFQKCSIYARTPLSNQKNTITAQGRDDINQNTGISIHQCKVDGAINQTYLGRPWKTYSRTVFMKTQLSSAINPAGWLEWDGAPANRSQTVYYGEYKNTGAGASMSNRVNWTRALNTSEASQFTVGSFIVGNEWLPSTGITYTASLS